MLNADLDPRYSACLHRLAEWTQTVIALSMRRIEAAEGRDFLAEVALFNDLGRSLRLTLGLKMRLASFTPVAVRAAALDGETRLPGQRPERPEALDRPERAETLLRLDNDHPAVRLEFERESETEADGHPNTPLGRAEALEDLLARGSHLDPDGRITAEVIQIKAFLTESSPEPPGRGPPPPSPPPSPLTAGASAPSASDPPLLRPLNRAERRRLRRSSG